MAGRNREVDAYIAGLSQDRRETLQALRDAVFEIVPDVVETMRYSLPRSKKPTEIYLRGFFVHTRACAQADGPLEFPSSFTIFRTKGSA